MSTRTSRLRRPLLSTCSLVLLTGAAGCVVDADDSDVRRGSERIATRVDEITQPAGITVERSSWNSDGWFVSVLDNPAVNRTSLPLVNVSGISPVGPFAQEIEGAGGGPSQQIQYRNSKFYFNVAAEGAADSNGLSLWGSVDVDSMYPNFDTYSGDPGSLLWIAPQTVGRPLVGRGARVGYKNWNGRLRSQRRNGQMVSASSAFKIRLDPDVALVPIEVAVMVSPSYRITNADGSPGDLSTADLRHQLAYWDQVEDGETSNVYEGADLAKTTNSKSLWMRKNQRGLYSMNSWGNQYTPDSAWSWVGEQGGAVCKVQFRIVNFIVVEVDDRQTFPKRWESGVQEEDPAHYLAGTLDDRPCRDNEVSVRAHPNHMPGIPVVSFMVAPHFGDSNERGRALESEQFVCVSSNTSSMPNIIPHELGHLAGLPDSSASCGTSSSMMCSEGGGDPFPTQGQCDAVRTWGQSINNALANGGGPWLGFARP